ncbi:MAG TPA: hypothetical protein VKB88_17105 [Bryobacteraceae bacterium]|nr:hypothetical protein [Bryobacteraceae bacterium]
MRGELEPFGEQRLKHRRDLIFGRPCPYLAGNLKAIFPSREGPAI